MPADCTWPVMISFSWAFWQQYQGSFISDTQFSRVILRYFRHYVGFFAITIPVFLFLLSLQYYLAGPAAQTALIHTLQWKTRGWGTELYHLPLRQAAPSSQSDLQINTQVSKTLRTTVHPVLHITLQESFSHVRPTHQAFNWPVSQRGALQPTEWPNPN